MSFQAIEDGVSTDGELFVAGLAEQILNVFILAMVTIYHQDMNGLLSDKVVGAGAGLEQKQPWVETVFFCRLCLSPNGHGKLDLFP